MDDYKVRIIRWLKNDGEFVRIDDLVCEIEMNEGQLFSEAKAKMKTFELGAWDNGILRHRASPGDVVDILYEFAVIERPGGWHL